MTVETVFEADDGVEVATHQGMVFKEGRIALAVYDASGVGATAYLQPEEAARLAGELVRLSEDGGESDG